MKKFANSAILSLLVVIFLAGGYFVGSKKQKLEIVALIPADNDIVEQELITAPDNLSIDDLQAIAPAEPEPAVVAGPEPAVITAPKPIAPAAKPKPVAVPAPKPSAPVKKPEPVTVVQEPVPAPQPAVAERAVEPVPAPAPQPTTSVS